MLAARWAVGAGTAALEWPDTAFRNAGYCDGAACRYNADDNAADHHPAGGTAEYAATDPADASHSSVAYRPAVHHADTAAALDAAGKGVRLRDQPLARVCSARSSVVLVLPQARAILHEPFLNGWHP